MKLAQLKKPHSLSEQIEAEFYTFQSKKIVHFSGRKLFFIKGSIAF